MNFKLRLSNLLTNKLIFVQLVPICDIEIETGCLLYFYLYRLKSTWLFKPSRIEQDALSGSLYKKAPLPDRTDVFPGLFGLVLLHRWFQGANVLPRLVQSLILAGASWHYSILSHGSKRSTDFSHEIHRHFDPNDSPMLFFITEYSMGNLLCD